MKTNSETALKFSDPESLKGREDRFCEVEVWVAPVLASWSQSMFAHEWLKPDGKIRTLAEMSEAMRNKRRAMESAIDEGQTLMKPVLGVGVLDNIEIGSGRDLFLALAARGVTSIPVYIPRSHKSEFKVFIRSES
ncbi:MAG: hypothetical protein WC043_09735 [Pseudobdellovibrionaceae bacterium]